MSVLIRGMQMPRNCMNCPVKIDTFCQILNIDVDPFYDGGVERNENCPLVELPEHHGRIIDEDEIIVPSLSSWADQAMVADAIQDAPTIIEKE